MTALEFEDGSVGFRQKIVLSILSSQPIHIKNIRHKSKEPGIRPSELDLLKLISEISNGVIVKLNDTGCDVFFSPGTLIGGEVEFTCSTERGLGYYLEPIVLLSSFTKVSMILTLNGITNNLIDPSVDVVTQSWLPFLKKFLPPASASSLKIVIKKRGVAPKGGGRIIFTSKPATFLSPIQLIIPGKVYRQDGLIDLDLHHLSRVRGVAWACLVSPGIASQLMYGAKKLLNSFLSDVYINIDHRKRGVGGESSGFGMILWAETKEGVFYTAEVCSAAESDTAVSVVPTIPSELGFEAASRLLNQVYLGGCVDESLQSLALSLMALEGGRNASQLLISEPTPHTIQTLRLLHKIMEVTFDLTYIDRVKLNEKKEEGGANESAGIGLQKEKVNPMNAREEGEESSAECPVPLVAICFGSGLKNINLSVR
ncbi:unnamed protein product [Hydatigera taeniaeformis]|uniref:RNA 3'-terminal phosphate cyclase-like protein n=1 Tax=Hydatigena taeniaeformis TaxID=6205 RepID=A0A0R3WPH0_HYDTA|nr:unnamed protein product [Hydatigera taeniaeformis]